MKQILNGFAENYYLTEEGEVYNQESKRKLKPYNNIYKLKTIEGKDKKIALKTLYKLVYDEVYCIDSIEDLPGEEWKVIEHTDNKYLCSNQGRIKSLTGYNAIILKPTENEKGYKRVDIVEEGRRSTKLVSRLVAAAFLEPPEHIDCELHHKDLNTRNNAASNLQWLLPMQHRLLHQQIRQRKKEQEDNASSTKPTNIDDK